MKFAIITHTLHKSSQGRYFGYGPYVREMNVWGKFASHIEVVAPLVDKAPGPIDLAYENPGIVLTPIPSFNIIGLKAKIAAVFKLPTVAFKIFGAMKRADHIHLRCPGNVGLIGCVMQVFFPSKPKTAKYAGNWDPKSRQPLSYRFQKWLLGNTFLTRNMTVLVYGEWPGSTRNIRPFFTATYPAKDIRPVPPRPLSEPLKFLFVGSLAPGKRPLYAIQLVETVNNMGFEASLDVYGSGKEHEKLSAYIDQKKLSRLITLHGSQRESRVRSAYKDAHFLILPSNSEGWPKVVAEAMFWSAVPIATRVSCVPQMLDHGNRGLLLDLDVEKDADAIVQLVKDPDRYAQVATAATAWSTQYTLDKFEREIAKLMSNEAEPDSRWN